MSEPEFVLIDGTVMYTDWSVGAILSAPDGMWNPCHEDREGQLVIEDMFTFATPAKAYAKAKWSQNQRIRLGE